VFVKTQNYVRDINLNNKSLKVSYVITKKKINLLSYKKIIMVRVKRGLFRIANQQVIKSLLYAYSGRKKKKRVFRQLWITRINAAVKHYNLKYNEFIHNLKKSKIILNRKMLSQLAILDPPAFSALVSATK